MEARRARLGLLAIGALALAARALPWRDVFADDGTVVLAMWDSAYHARRAFWSFANFPALLHFDSYLAYPAGARVPMPPLYDWALAAVARALASDEPGFARVAAWWSPFFAAATLLPIHAAGRAVAGRGVGLAAAALFAVLPASVAVSSLGDADHHAVAAFLGAGFAALALSAARSERLLRLGVGLALVRAALATSWSGSLLPLGLGDATLALVALVAGRPALLRVQGGSALAAAALAALGVAWSGTPEGDAWSALTLSWLHVAWLVLVAAAALALAALERRRPLATAAGRVARGAALAAGVAAAGLAAAPLREALEPAFAFLAGRDVWAPANVEQRSLFATGATALFGYYAWLLPLTPLVALARAREQRVRAACLGLALPLAALGVLALAQARFANDFAPLGCVAFALGLDALRGALARVLPSRAALALAALAGAALLWPAATGYGLPRLERALLGSGPPELGPASLVRFARRVREVTPETSGYLDAARPEYGVLCKPSHGHAIVWEAHRPTSANGFGPYLDAERYEAVLAFYRATSEARAVEIARALEARYAITWDHDRLASGRFAHFLHRLDGTLGAGWRHAEHFRLIDEGPQGGVPLFTSFPRGAPRGVIPYKLFERVEGVRVEARPGPGGALHAALDLVTPGGRRFTWRAAARAGADGVARLRLPYATDGATPTKAAGPYRIEVGGRSSSLSLAEAQVLAGDALVVAP